ncbi:hypothetical protein GE061_003501 [Apolygus lucorum]|uniref:C2H2-type domain-containing protein n=1 Tax=Apolygus lucorum TaxID=248454 RepID=A0A8S9X285_APOLU|nr:hypothetical protein GE061_003501 [Apolygus lucorum]
MTKRNGSDEQVWLLVGDDGSLQTLKKGKLEDEEFDDRLVEEDAEDEDGDTVHEDLDASGSVLHEVYVDQSQLVEEGENSEIDLEAADATDDGINVKEESTSNNIGDDDPSAIAAVVVKWTDQATFRLLDLLDQVTAKESEMPGKSDRVWIRIAQDMKPFYFTADECYKKFLYLKKTYRKALGRMAKNQPYKWRYFNRMCGVMGESVKPPPPSGESVTKVNNIEPVASTSAAGLADEDDSETGLSKFDQLLCRKKEMLIEVRHQGEILQKHVEECLASTTRREHRESEMIHLLQELKAQEQKKLDLFKKLLDKLCIFRSLKVVFELRNVFIKVHWEAGMPKEAIEADGSRRTTRNKLLRSSLVDIGKKNVVNWDTLRRKLNFVSNSDFVEYLLLIAEKYLISNSVISYNDKRWDKGDSLAPDCGKTESSEDDVDVTSHQDNDCPLEDQNDAPVAPENRLGAIPSAGDDDEETPGTSADHSSSEELKNQKQLSDHNQPEDVAGVVESPSRAELRKIRKKKFRAAKKRKVKDGETAAPESSIKTAQSTFGKTDEHKIEDQKSSSGSGGTKICQFCDTSHPNEGCPLSRPPVSISDSCSFSSDAKVDYATSSIPSVLEMREKDTKGTVGIFAKAYISKYTQFGPLVGVSIKEMEIADDSPMKHVWEISEGTYLSTSDPEKSNWIRWLCPAPTRHDRNVVPLEREGKLYFVTTAPIDSGSEMYFWAEMNGPWASKKMERTSCGGCNLQFEHPMYYRTHCAVFHEASLSLTVRKYHCKVCDLAEVLHEFQCRDCLKILGSRAALQRHTKEVHKRPSGVSCSKCSKTFQNKSNLKIHMLTHSGVKPFQCQEGRCSAAFTTKQCLQFHYKKVHGLTEDRFPSIVRSVEYTFESYAGVRDGPLDNKDTDDTSDSSRLQMDNGCESSTEDNRSNSLIVVDGEDDTNPPTEPLCEETSVIEYHSSSTRASKLGQELSENGVMSGKVSQASRDNVTGVIMNGQSSASLLVEAALESAEKELCRSLPAPSPPPPPLPPSRSPVPEVAPDERHMPDIVIPPYGELRRASPPPTPHYVSVMYDSVRPSTPPISPQQITYLSPRYERHYLTPPPPHEFIHEEHRYHEEEMAQNLTKYKYEEARTMYHELIPRYPMAAADYYPWEVLRPALSLPTSVDLSVSAGHLPPVMDRPPSPPYQAFHVPQKSPVYHHYTSYY